MTNPISRSRPKLLLIGDQGQVAFELKRTLCSLGTVIVASRQGGDVVLDLADIDSIAAIVEQVNPDVIVNAAAYTAVDKAESERELAQMINGDALVQLAFAAKNVGALLIHYSTDYVFDGTKTEPYCEADAVNPQSEYGRSKLVGEQALATAQIPHLIFRTSWVYGTRGNNFLRTIRRLAREREMLKIVADQMGCPTWSRHIAEATAQVLAQIGVDRRSAYADWDKVSGIYHLVSGGQGSWFDFAGKIVAHLRRNESIACRELLPIATHEYPLPAPRPKYSVMNTNKLCAQFGVQLPHWEAALAQVLQEIDQPKI